MSEQLRMPETHRHLHDLQLLVRGEAPPPPVAKLVGFNLVQIELGSAVFELPAGPQHANPMGTLHGGIIVDVADAAMGCALATTLEDEESFTTLDMTANYFKPIWSARLKATATVVRRTRTLGFIECEIRDEKKSLVAKAFSTCMVLRGQDARGR